MALAAAMSATSAGWPAGIAARWLIALSPYLPLLVNISVLSEYSSIECRFTAFQGGAALAGRDLLDLFTIPVRRDNDESDCGRLRGVSHADRPGLGRRLDLIRHRLRARHDRHQPAPAQAVLRRSARRGHRLPGGGGQTRQRMARLRPRRRQIYRAGVGGARIGQTRPSGA